MTAVEPFLTSMGGPRLHDPVLVEPGDDAGVAAHRRLRRAAFVEAQGLFADHDLDVVDDDPATTVLVARRHDDGAVLGGVRVHPHDGHGGLGWWRGSRLVVDPGAERGVGARLVRAATALAEDRGAVRFDATVQADKERFFARLGWTTLDRTTVAGAPHVLMLGPGGRLARATADKAPLGRLVGDLAPGGAGWVGDDAAPVPGAALVAACDAITPAMVERDPEWAGWCAVLVNVNDLAAMGAVPVGLLDAVAGRSEEHVAAVLRGIRAAAEAYGLPVLGGHTQVGQHGALAVTALGATDDPVPGGGGRPGDVVHLVADLGGAWRPGHAGRQWDSTTHRRPHELRELVGTLTRHRPAAAKDVSMAGLVGTLAMLAEASGTGAELDVAGVPRPEGAAMADWLTCFPGFALLTADRPGAAPPSSPRATTAPVGRLTAPAPAGAVSLVWPDGRRTLAVAAPATGLGPAAVPPPTEEALR